MDRKNLKIHLDPFEIFETKNIQENVWFNTDIFGSHLWNILNWQKGRIKKKNTNFPYNLSLAFSSLRLAEIFHRWRERGKNIIQPLRRQISLFTWTKKLAIIFACVSNFKQSGWVTHTLSVWNNKGINV